ncbi:glutamate racemase [Syntrophomonas erecta subsp. sporosyntropha]
MNDRPIGVFDSGVGGLTVVRSMLQYLPDEGFIYFGDTAHVPYGNKTEEQLLRYAHNIISYLISRGVKAILVACGTHSSVTMPLVQDQFPLPLLGVVKAGARTAARVTSNGRIGITATQATINSRAYTRELQFINHKFEVFETACPSLVPMVEVGQLSGIEVRNAVAAYIGPLLDKGIDTLVLGCTHYPFLTPVIKDFVGSAVTVVDPSLETVEELKSLLATSGLLHQAETDKEPLREFYVSGDDQSFYRVGRLLMGDVIKKVNHIDID